MNLVKTDKLKISSENLIGIYWLKIYKGRWVNIDLYTNPLNYSTVSIVPPADPTITD